LNNIPIPRKISRYAMIRCAIISGAICLSGTVQRPAIERRGNEMATAQSTKSINGIDLNVLQETVNAIKSDPGLGKCKFRARNKWLGAAHNRTTVNDFYAAKQEMSHKRPFKLHCDEPPMLAGEDEGANPVEHLLNALAGCVTTGMIAHAAVRGIEIEECESELEGDIDLNGFLGLNPKTPKGYTNIRMKFKIKSSADPEKLKSLAEFSPVYNTLINGAKVDIDIQNE
jgi:uncharacterized OsmC-like protein